VNETAASAAGRDAFAFHAAVERPGAFLRREWKAIAIVAGAFVAIMLGLVFALDPAFFYPRIETDQLRYMLKAKAFVETGSHAAREAVNGRIFIYAAAPGLLRAPFFFLFDEFDDRLRAVQAANVLITAASAILSAYILSWVLPPRTHRWAVVFAFVFVVLSPDWVTNMLVPLPDAPYALLTQACAVLAVTAIATERPFARSAWLVALFVILLTIAFFLRYTALVLLVYAAILLRQRWTGRRIPVRTMAFAGAGAAVVLMILLAASASNVLNRYMYEPLYYLVEAKKIPVTLHLLAAAIPAQIVPVFNLGFEVPPLTSRSAPVFATTPRDIAWTICGLVISAAVIRGMLISRRRLLPEIAYVLIPLPLLAILASSTTRYLMSYQPFIWMFFVTGAAAVAVPAFSRVSPRAARAGVAVAALATMAGVVAMRSSRTAETTGGGPLAYTRDVSQTFRALRTFLEHLPRDSTLLVEARGNVGRFKLISNIDYYMPDSALTEVARARKVYSVLACGSPAQCADFDYWKVRQSRLIDPWGDFEYHTVFERVTPGAHALVQQLVPRAYSASGRAAR
jgi:hypothetical protein